MLGTTTLTGKFFIGLAAGIVVGAVGYKMVVDKKINPKDLQKTVLDLANKFTSKGGKGNGNCGGAL